MDALRSPVLTYDQTWASAIPNRILKLVVQARMLSLIKEDEMASYPEAVAYMITANLNHPIPSDWAEIYIHVCCTVCEEHFGEDHWKELDGQKTLNQCNQNKLVKLCQWIYEKRRHYVKEKLKEMKIIRNEEISKPDPVKVVQATQMSLWDS